VLAWRRLGRGVIQHKGHDGNSCGAHAERDADDPLDHRCCELRQIGFRRHILAHVIQARLYPRQPLARLDREIFQLA